MIIKKQRLAQTLQAQIHSQSEATQATPHRPPEGHGDSGSVHSGVSVVEPPVVQANPYATSLSPEDFELGRVPDRRRKTRESDRRQGFRREEDQMLLTRAEEEAIAIKERAEAQGFEEGLKRAESEIEKLTDQMSGFITARETALATAAEDLAQMAVSIAEAILKTEVSCDNELVLSLVRTTIQKAGRGQKSVLIKVNPTDVALVKDAMKTDSGLSAAVEILVLEDPTVDPGSCMVETQAGLVDARFSTQLEILTKMMTTGGKA